MIDSAVYLAGRRTSSPATLADTFALLAEEPDSRAWIGPYRPADAQLLSAAEQLGLHELAVEDAIVAHPRPVGAGARGGAVRDPGHGRRRVRAGDLGVAERHR
ncbi:hypothetical protein AB0H37_42690 [Actinomadura sp. NPDC023710]|uniref:hypothetical protein n=1 Tax=Actinomadura sp. NPDC023710 TaxID=3158219 RepID=UPI0033F31D65